MQIPSYKCRIELSHVEPSGKFTATEREEFFRATQMLAARHEQHNQDVQNLKGPRRTYKNWTEHELYTLAVGWWFFKPSTADLRKAFDNRSESQVRG